MLTRHCGDHFAIYANIKSLYCTSETNIMLYVNYIPQLKINTEWEKLQTMSNMLLQMTNQFSNLKQP